MPTLKQSAAGSTEVVVVVEVLNGARNEVVRCCDWKWWARDAHSSCRVVGISACGYFLRFWIPVRLPEVLDPGHLVDTCENNEMSLTAL
jgi:hypothetical protein